MGYSRKKCHRGRVAKLWNINPHCHWCGTKTERVDNTLEQPKVHPHSATFDHLYHKSEPQRRTRKGRNAGVLACYSCNQKRGRDAHIKSLPAWNRLLIRLKIPLPVWKIRKKIDQLKQHIKAFAKKANWAKRHIKYKLKGSNNVKETPKRTRKRPLRNSKSHGQAVRRTPQP